jgi:tetratricopeptide (TPR) repeat protein
MMTTHQISPARISSSPVNMRSSAKLDSSESTSSFYVASSVVESALQNYDDGDKEKALRMLTTALKTQRLTLGDSDLCVAHTLGNIGSVYISLGWLEDAEQVLQDCLNIKSKIRADPTNELPKGCDHVNMYDTLSNLGSVYFLQGDYYNAMCFYQDCLQEITAGENAGTASDIANTLYNIGHVHCVLNEYEDALIAMNESLQLTQSKFGHEDVRAAETWEKIGAIHLAQNNFDDALSAFVEALRITKLTLGSGHVDCAPALYHVGLVYERRHEARLAMETYRAALDIFQRNGIQNESVEKIRQRIMRLKV